MALLWYMTYSTIHTLITRILVFCFSSTQLNQWSVSLKERGRATLRSTLSRRPRSRWIVSYCKTQPPASIGWVALSSLFVCCSFVPHPWHILSSPLFDVSDHTNHIFSVRIWSWQHVSVIHCWVEPSLLLSSSPATRDHYFSINATNRFNSHDSTQLACLSRCNSTGFTIQLFSHVGAKPLPKISFFSELVYFWYPCSVFEFLFVFAYFCFCLYSLGLVLCVRSLLCGQKCLIWLPPPLPPPPPPPPPPAPLSNFSQDNFSSFCQKFIISCCGNCWKVGRKQFDLNPAFIHKKASNIKICGVQVGQNLIGPTYGEWSENGGRVDFMGCVNGEGYWFSF